MLLPRYFPENMNKGLSHRILHPFRDSLYTSRLGLRITSCPLNGSCCPRMRHVASMYGPPREMATTPLQLRRLLEILGRASMYSREPLGQGWLSTRLIRIREQTTI